MSTINFDVLPFVDFIRSAFDKILQLWNSTTISLGDDISVTFIWIIISFIALVLLTKIFYRGAQK